MLTQARLIEVLRYEPETGIFYWLVSGGRRTAGKVAGTLHHTGYIQISIDYKLYRAHRLAWLYVTGKWPEGGEIDHKNWIRADNRWCNLRASDCSQNKMNRARQADNSSGYKGVTFDKKNQKWAARIKKDRKAVHLGRYMDIIEAARAYDRSAIMLFGEFAQTNFPREDYTNA